MKNKYNSQLTILLCKILSPSYYQLLRFAHVNFKYFQLINSNGKSYIYKHDQNVNY